MKIIYIGETPSFENGLPDGMVSVGFNAENKPVFEIPGGSILPDGSREAADADLAGLPNPAKAFAKQMTRSRIYRDVADLDSLSGKTSNLTVATSRILLSVMGKLATAQSLADVRGAVEPYVPLMQKLQAKIDAGEIMSVQYAQGLDDEAAIFEGLEVLTKVARVFAPDATP